MFTRINFLVFFTLLFQSSYASSSVNPSAIVTENLNIYKTQATGGGYNSPDSIEMQLLPNVLLRTEDKKIVQCVIMNKTEEILYFGDPVTIERFVNGRWQNVPLLENLGWPDYLGVVRPKSKNSQPYGIPFILDDEFKKAGRYRLCKELWFKSKPEQKILVTAEFTIK
ncbi:immunoglobulin-like domain-containing protein [Sphingobacterium sp. xlx-130]|uniref:immunoglobulin-like domain-containing protein n=1 Tax=Sphingobacterium sp. xlx-130 TaxID=2654323 RepID=UPI0013DA0114|nr:immunoglobulin-like domain-containing protein [Sphingobacterium sp. xlx-130]